MSYQSARECGSLWRGVLWLTIREILVKTMDQFSSAVSIPGSWPVAVKSRSTPVGGLVKSGWRRMKEESRGLDKRLVRPELVTTWIQQLRITSVDPLRRFWSRWLRRRQRQRQIETGVVTKLILDWGVQDNLQSTYTKCKLGPSIYGDK